MEEQSSVDSKTTTIKSNEKWRPKRSLLILTIILILIGMLASFFSGYLVKTYLTADNNPPLTVEPQPTPETNNEVSNNFLPGKRKGDL